MPDIKGSFNDGSFKVRAQDGSVHVATTPVPTATPAPTPTTTPS